MALHGGSEGMATPTPTPTPTATGPLPQTTPALTSILTQPGKVTGPSSADYNQKRVSASCCPSRRSCNIQKAWVGATSFRGVLVAGKYFLRAVVFGP